MKQLLYILTVARDGGTPMYFTAASGNVTDDTTHRDTWDLLCRLAERKDFLYVADCKLATTANMNYITRNHGRFITVLPRTRKEDGTFRERLVQGQIAWRHLLDKTNGEDQVIDRLSVCDEPALSKEGFRIWWYYSTRKAELDVAARTTRINRALAQLSGLRDRLLSPRTRIRTGTKAAEALLERELRQAMKDAEVKSLPMYPESRPCRRPTTRRLIDLFDTVQRHTLQTGGRKPAIMITELSRAQRKILKLLRLTATEYGR